MDDTDLSAVSEDGAGDVPDGGTSTLDYRRYSEMYLYNRYNLIKEMPFRQRHVVF